MGWLDNLLGGVGEFYIRPDNVDAERLRHADMRATAAAEAWSGVKGLLEWAINRINDLVVSVTPVAFALSASLKLPRNVLTYRTSATTMLSAFGRSAGRPG